ncbi:hypothetical protein BGX34_011641 [Mortierella sp. NVP85]|nr:hypothetical protein BGX34_011641 [Mortierella sp. NVP85]
MSNIQDRASDGEEEEDYMSEAFLSKLVQESGGDKAKKDSMTYSERRRQKEIQHLANLPKPLHVREKEARDKGLETEIGEDNRGMAMLLRMGFKKGGTLGAPKPSGGSGSESLPSGPSQSLKPDNVQTGALRAPIAIQMKQGRGGIGMDNSRKRQAEEELQRKEKEEHRVFDEGYRGQKGDQYQLEKRKRQLGAARAICMRMDANRAEEVTQSRGSEAGNMERSNKFWWIADSVPDEILGTPMMGPGAEVDLDSTGGDHGPSRELPVREGPESEMQKRVKLDPSLAVEDEEAEDKQPVWGERPEFASLEVSDKLDKVVQYLRDEYCYCFWCAAQYDGSEDLEGSCPGETEDDH